MTILIARTALRAIAGALVCEKIARSKIVAGAVPGNTEGDLRIDAASRRAVRMRGARVQRIMGAMSAVITLLPWIDEPVAARSEHAFRDAIRVEYARTGIALVTVRLRLRVTESSASLANKFEPDVQTRISIGAFHGFELTGLRAPIVL
jgi:hypothetical protein